MRLYTPGYDLDFVPDLVLEAATSVTALNLDQNNITVIPGGCPTREGVGEYLAVGEQDSRCFRSAMVVSNACLRSQVPVEGLGSRV